MVIRFSSPRDRNAALRTLDGAGPTGFFIAGADRKFVPAQARVMGGSRMEVWNDDVPEPVAVRYAWGDNAAGNLQSRGNLPLTPFRTDDWSEVNEPR
jgi:sialate O-acetylesterase